ncbi:hypothetical protein D1007_26078 [Hordeum vulgare]|nr:hypothetical protein D1007_26078 [Hordeum vulgare]
MDSGRQASWGANFFRSHSRAAEERQGKDGSRGDDQRELRRAGDAGLAIVLDMANAAMATEAQREGEGSAAARAARTCAAILRRDQAGAPAWCRIERPLVAAATADTSTPPRGRSPIRLPSPSSARRQSTSNRTPPGSPDSVLPATVCSKGGQTTLMEALSIQAQAKLCICSPLALVRPLTFSSPTRAGLECAQ